jgi:hypothetical protein
MHFNKHLNHSILNHSTMYLSYTRTLDGKEANRYLDINACRLCKGEEPARPWCNANNKI